MYINNQTEVFKKLEFLDGLTGQTAVRFGLMTGQLRFGYGYGLNPKFKPVYHP